VSLLEIRGLGVSAGAVPLVRAVDLSIARGETLCLAGESGSGKSLTALALMDLLGPGLTRRAAEARFDGIDLLDRGAATRLRGDRMAMIFQEPMTALNPVFTIGGQLEAVYRRHRGGGSAEARRRALHLLERVGIGAPERRLRQFPHELSGGLRQRAMIAMALMCQPDLLIADEPTTALDVTVQAEILRLLKDLQNELGLALILITHDLGVASRMADRCAVMYAGEIVETADRRTVFKAPRHPYTQALLRCIPVLGDAAPGTRLLDIPGAMPPPGESETGCAFRARCTLAVEECASTPPLKPVAGGSARCWFAQ